MRAVLISIQPYWVFLIIAKAMGWNIEKEKTVEVRKNYPKAENWDKIAKIYCSKDKKSFAKIPKEYQPLMQQFLGKVIGKFVCDEIFPIRVFENGSIQDYNCHGVEHSCVPYDDISAYIGKDRTGYGWHISDLVIYDKPRELSEFTKPFPEIPCLLDCDLLKCEKCHNKPDLIKRPPQSWCYVEGKLFLDELENDERLKAQCDKLYQSAIKPNLRKRGKRMPIIRCRIKCPFRQLKIERAKLTQKTEKETIEYFLKRAREVFENGWSYQGDVILKVLTQIADEIKSEWTE